jgi:hypothetical protein
MRDLNCGGEKMGLMERLVEHNFWKVRKGLKGVGDPQTVQY